MKKFIIFMLLCIPLNIYSLNYKYLDEYVEDDNYLIKEEKLYKFYEEEMEYTLDYYLDSNNPKEYPYKSNISKEVISSYLDLKPKELPNRVISTYNLSGYYSLKPVNRIEIRNFNTEIVNGDINLTEITILYKGEKIDYLAHCYRCSGYIEVNLNNDVFISSGGSVNYFSTLELELTKEYNPQDLEIILYFYNQSSNTTFSVYLFDKDVTTKFSYNSISDYFDYIKYNVDLNNALNSDMKYLKEYRLKLNKDNIKKYKWDTNLIESNEELNEDFYKKVSDKVVYKYKDILYKYYKINKKYLNGYFLEAPFYKRDESDYITRYLYIEKDISNKECTTLENEVKSNKNVENNIINPSTFNKSRHIYLVIIILTLFLMGYMLYSLRKE